MYLAFNSEVYIHESIPPEDTSKLWLQITPQDRIVPTSELFVASDTQYIPTTKQMLAIYKFETVPQVLAYSTVNQRWEVCVGAYTLLSSDGYVLKDSNGIYLITEKGNRQ